MTDFTIGEVMGQWLGRLESRAARPDFAEAVRKISEPLSEWERFEGFREFYRVTADMPGGPAAHMWDWTPMMSPIEKAVWKDMRVEGFSMLPQYPAGRFFLDFADPDHRVAVECDGRDWHEPHADRKRDEALAADGWRVFRFSGRDCWRCWEPDWEQIREQLENGRGDVAQPRVLEWLSGTSEGGIAAIGFLFYGCPPRFFTRNQAVRALNARLLAGDISELKENE